MTLVPYLTTEPSPMRDYLAGESVDKIRTFSSHQGHRCTCTVIKTYDGEYHLVPNATIIAVQHFAEEGEVYEIDHGKPFVIDNVVHAIVDDKPFHNPRIVRVPECFRPVTE